jgi:transcription elongation GreA/GreB family factor
VTQVVAWAAGNGDRSENADYLYGKRRLRQIDSRIRFLTKRIDAAEVVDPSAPRAGSAAARVFFGATVTYKVLVGDSRERRGPAPPKLESDSRERRGPAPPKLESDSPERRGPAPPKLESDSRERRGPAPPKLESDSPERRRVSIVGVDEVDLNRRHISWMSPLARALMNSRPGDRVVLRAPRRTEHLEVLAVEYAPIPMEPYHEPPGAEAIREP